MGNPLVTVLCAGAICCAIVGYLNAMEVLFMLALAVALFHNFSTHQLFKKLARRK